MKRFGKINSGDAAIFRIAVTLFLLVLIPFTVLSGVYFGLNRRIQIQTYERGVESLEYNAQKMEMLFDNLDNICMYFADNYDIINFLKLDPEEVSDVNAFIKAKEHLAAMKMGNNEIVNIQIYSDRGGFIVDGYTCAVDPERYYKGFFSIPGLTEKQFEMAYLKTADPVVYRQADMLLQNNRQNVLIYDRLLTGVNIPYYQNRILFYLKSGSVFASASGTENAGGFRCVTDSEGKVIFSDFGDSGLPEGMDIGEFEGEKGYLIKKLDGKKMFFTYHRSSQRNLISVEVVPLERVLDVTASFRLILTALLFLTVIFGLFVTILIIFRSFSPIRKVSAILGGNVAPEDFVEEISRLVKSNTELTEKMKQQVSIMKTEAFYSLFMGECIEESEIRKKLDMIQLRQDAEIYAVLLLSCNDMGVDSGIEEISAQKVFIEEMIRKQALPELQGIYQIDYERMALLFASDDGSVSRMRELADTLAEKLIREMSENGSYSITVGADILTDIARLPNAFLHVQQAQNLPVNICGSGKIQWYDHERIRQYRESRQFEENIDKNTGDNDNVTSQLQALIDNVKTYVLEHYTDQQLSLTMVGEAFDVTDFYLSKLFKRATGVNFSKYLEQIRIEKARELLKAGVRVTDAGSRVGYNSSQVFRRAYKRYYGISPSEDLETEKTESQRRIG